MTDVDTTVAWTRWYITRLAWVLAAGLAWAWRSELIEIIEHCSSASLPARLSIYGSVYVVLAGLAFPGAVLLTIFAGPLFGTLLGTVVASFVSTLGASVAFLGSRTLYSAHGQQTGHRIGWLSGERLGGWELLMLRLLPIVPFFAVNLLAGRSRLSLARFWIISQIGMLPATIILVRAGSTLPKGESLSRSETLAVCWPLLLLAALVYFGRWIKAKRRVRHSSSARFRRRPAWTAKSSLLMVAFLLPCLGCAVCRTQKAPLLNEIYGPVAQLPDYLRNPVIVIPGVLGSRLVDKPSGKLVWGKFERARFFRRGTTAQVHDIALPMREGVPLSHLQDAIQSDGTLAYLEIDLAGLPVEIQAYDQMLHALGVGGYRDPQHPRLESIDYGEDHFTCFQFDYDWRRDVSENAARLHEFIENRRQYIRREYQQRFGIVNADVKFDIVTHSMGGLVARYYLRYGPRPLPDDGSLPPLDWAGAQNVARVVLVGTPNAGSTLAIRDLVNGHQLAPLLPKYPPAVLGTMPSIYQLLPRPRHGALVDKRDQRKLDVYDPALWRELRWSLANPDQDRVLQELLPDVEDRDTRLRIACDHQVKCLARARQLHHALDIPASPPPGVTLHLFAGDSIPTPAILATNLDGEIETASSAAGDDTTTRASALMDERLAGGMTGALVTPIHWTSTVFLHASHRGLTSDPIFTDNVLSLLLESRHQPPYLQPQ